MVVTIKASAGNMCSLKTLVSIKSFSLKATLFFYHKKTLQYLLYDVPVGYVPPPPYFEAEYCLFCGRRRVAVARYRMICLVLVNSHLFPLPCGAGSAVPREGFDLSVIILASLLVFRCWAAVTLCYGS